MMKVFICAAIGILAAAGTASAQATWVYRGRLSLETALVQANLSSPLVKPGQRPWNAGGLFVGTADTSWDPSARLHVGGGGVITASDGGDVDVRLREGYARMSLAPWMDVEAGKRLVRWGVGYGFSPTGVLDPVRVATDPNDRLGRNEGRTLVRADVFRGPASLTIAGTGGLFAARLQTVVRGLEVALIGTAAADARPSYGANVTHVIGQRLEWHAEMLVHAPARGGKRTVSAAAGFQYTFAAGANVVVEYHRNAADASSVFVRAVRADAERGLVPELIVIANLADGGWTVVPAMTWTAHPRIQVYARSTHLAGGPRSTVAFAPWSMAVTVGATFRF